MSIWKLDKLGVRCTNSLVGAGHQRTQVRHTEPTLPDLQADQGPRGKVGDRTPTVIECASSARPSPICGQLKKCYVDSIVKSVTFWALSARITRLTGNPSKTTIYYCLCLQRIPRSMHLHGRPRRRLERGAGGDGAVSGVEFRKTTSNPIRSSRAISFRLVRSGLSWSK